MTWWVNGMKEDGTYQTDGPFDSFDEAVTWANTHEFATYGVDFEEKLDYDGFEDDWVLSAWVA